MCERAKQKGLAKVAEVEFVLRAEEVRHGLHWIMSSIYAYNVCRVFRIILLIILLSFLCHMHMHTYVYCEWYTLVRS